MFSDLLFADVEATGTENEDRLIQVAYRNNGTDCNEFFTPPVPIKIPAMAVHHITPKMLEGKPKFFGSPTHQHLNLLSSTAIFVAHNAKYDLDMLAKEAITFPRHICTLKVARHLGGANGQEFENHQLQYLRYFFGIEIEAVAHDAFGDIVVLEAVFAKLFEELRQQEFADKLHTELDVLVRMIEISRLPSLMHKFTFGKYYGKAVAEVAKDAEGRSWMKWLLDQKQAKPEGEEDWIYTLKQYV